MKIRDLLSEAHHAYDNPSVLDTKFQPLKAGDTVRVYHGFRDLPDAVDACTHGMTGKERVARVYSYESDNNPKGIFVTLSFKTAAEFGGTIIEFVARSEELEAPVWPGGGYTVQGQYSQYFGHGAKGRAARNARRKAARAETEADFARRSDPENWGHVTGSDDMLTANMLLNSHEYQALFIGDLAPNRIVAVYTRDQNTVNSPYTRHTVEEFLSDKDTNKTTNRDRRVQDRVLGPEEKFDGNLFIERLTAKFGGYVRKDMAATLKGFWRNVLEAPAGKRVRVFQEYFGPYMWPGQYRDAMLWMKSNWGVRPMGESVMFGEPVSIGEMLGHRRHRHQMGPTHFVHPVLAEQAFERSKIERLMLGSFPVINSHLIPLLAFETNEAVDHWRKEIRIQTKMLARMIYKDTKANITREEYMEIFWDGPFGHGVSTVTEAIADVQSDKPRLVRNSKTDEAVYNEIKAWHEGMAAEISQGRDGSALIADTGPQKPSFTKRRR